MQELPILNRICRGYNCRNALKQIDNFCAEFSPLFSELRGLLFCKACRYRSVLYLHFFRLVYKRKVIY